MVQRQDTRLARIPLLFELALVAPEVAGFLFFTKSLIDTPDEFSPADDLTNEPL